MNELCMIIKDMVKPNFLNIRTSIQTYDRDAICCGAPCWRWAYHALHSADKWFINPCVYDEPPFHEEGLDNPDKPVSVILSDEQHTDVILRIMGLSIAVFRIICRVMNNSLIFLISRLR